MPGFAVYWKNGYFCTKAINAVVSEISFDFFFFLLTENTTSTRKNSISMINIGLESQEQQVELIEEKLIFEHYLKIFLETVQE